MSAIGEYVRGLLDDYQELRETDWAPSSQRAFWDAVVISCLDKGQQAAFELQIDDKRRRRELPQGLPVFVVPDPQGPRIGNGGSTLTVLEFLESKYGPELDKMKIFLIHAGGWSQRMPSASVLGKVFSVLPYGSPPFQMLDLKLALYWPFVDKVGPGVFVLCADDFSIHNLGLDFRKSAALPPHGVTALAHPSPIALGRGHGVYVIENQQDVEYTRHVVPVSCAKVIQKPNDEKMRLEGAVLCGTLHTFADGIELRGEAVYTDSSFYMGLDVVKKLLQLKHSLGELRCEIDAYGDIMQSLGTRATPDYIHNCSNVSHMTEDLLDTRRRVFDCLHQSHINLLLLNASAYIHIGTTRELVKYFCRDEYFQHSLQFQRNVFNSWTATRNTGSKNGNVENRTCTPQDCKNSNDVLNRNDISEFSCVIHSSVHRETKIGPDSFLEFCDFEIPVIVEGNSIISNCQLSSVLIGCMTITITENTFLHTIPIFDNKRPEQTGNDNNSRCVEDSIIENRSSSNSIKNKNSSSSGSSSNNSAVGFVTVVMSIDEDMKRAAMIPEVGRLAFNGRDVNFYLDQRGLTVADILPNSTTDARSTFGSIEMSDCETKTECKSYKEDEVLTQKFSLWDMKIFPAFSSMTSSLLDAIDIRLGNDVRISQAGGSVRFFSMSDLLTVKDVGTMLGYRRALYEKIINSY